MESLAVNDRLSIPLGEIRVSFALAGGPGGQNVNKVATKVVLRWIPAESAALGEADRRWLLQRLAARLSAKGELIVTSTRTRTQAQNRDDALAKLAQIVAEALRRPKPRKKSRPSRAARERRLKEKKQRGRLKKDRGYKPE